MRVEARQCARCERVLSLKCHFLPISAIYNTYKITTSSLLSLLTQSDVRQAGRLMQGRNFGLKSGDTNSGGEERGNGEGYPLHPRGYGGAS